MSWVGFALPPVSAPFSEKPFAFPVKPAPLLVIRNSVIGGSLRLCGENFLPQSQRDGSVPVLPLTSYVNLGKADIFIETKFPLLSMEIVTAPSTIQGCWQGPRREWIWTWFVDQRVSFFSPNWLTSVCPILEDFQNWQKAGPLLLREAKVEDGLLLHSLAHREGQWPRCNSVLLPGSLNSEGVTKRPLVLPGRVRDFSHSGDNRGVWSPVLVTSGMATMNV